MGITFKFLLILLFSYFLIFIMITISTKRISHLCAQFTKAYVSQARTVSHAGQAVLSFLKYLRDVSRAGSSEPYNNWHYNAKLTE